MLAKRLPLQIILDADFKARRPEPKLRKIV